MHLKAVMFSVFKKLSAAAKAEMRCADVAHMRSGDDPRQDPNGCVYMNAVRNNVQLCFVIN